MGDATIEAHYSTKAPPFQPTGHLPWIQGRIGGEVAWGCNSRGMLYYEGSTMQPHATFHRHRVGSAERWHRECKGRDATLQRLHHCSHRPPSIDPGSGQQRGGTENAKAEMLYYEGSTIAAIGHLP